MLQRGGMPTVTGRHTLPCTVCNVYGFYLQRYYRHRICHSGAERFVGYASQLEHSVPRTLGKCVRTSFFLYYQRGNSDIAFGPESEQS